MVSTLLEADVGPFEVFNVRQVLELCPEVTLKVYFKQTVAMAIMKVYFRTAKYDYALGVGYPQLDSIKKKTDILLKS